MVLTREPPTAGAGVAVPSGTVAERGPAGAERPKYLSWGLALVVFAGAFFFRASDPQFANDHFRVMSQGRQVLVYGEMPFRDFVDPGNFLQIYTSAAAQLLFGYSLFGEALLSIFLLSAGYALTFLLAARASRSAVIGLVVTVLAIATNPRLYAYDKVFLLPFGLWLCWRYVDRPTARNLAIVAFATAFAFLFRHDYGVYLGAAAAATLAAVHWREGLAPLLRRSALYGGIVAVTTLPFFVFLEANGGVVDYFRSALDFVRAEAPRRELFLRQRFLVDGSRPLLGPANAESWLYYLFASLPPIALLVLIAGRFRRRPAAERLPGETSRILGAVVMCALATRGMVRPPLEYRLADVAALAAVIGAWLIGRWLGGRTAAREDAPRPERSRWPRPVDGLRLAPVLVLLGITGWAVLGARGLDDELEKARLAGDPGAAARQLRATADRLRTSPPIDRWAGPNAVGLQALARYVHECTRPADRLLVGFFAPEMYFYSGRGFAGGNFFWFRGLHSSEGAQQKAIWKLQAQSVPIVILEPEVNDKGRGFLSTYGQVGDYLSQRYRVAGESTFGGEHPYRVLVDVRATPTATYDRLALPCFT